MREVRRQIPYLHYLRVIAILMVIALHSISPYMSNAALYASKSWYAYLLINAVSRCGVPLFLMISGYLLLSADSSADFKLFYKRRLPRILIPLALWNVIYYIFYCIFNGSSFKISELFSQILDCGTAYHFWYVYTLLGIYLLTPFLKRIADSCSFKELVWFEILICLCTTLRPFINTVTPVYIYLFDPLLNGYIGFFVLGYILGKTDFTKKQLVFFACAGIAGIFISAAGNHAASSNKEIDLVFNSGYSLCYFMTASGVFALFKSIDFKEGRAFKIFKSLSAATFGIYLVHVGVMDIIMRRFMIEASPIVSSAYLFVLTAVLSTVLSYAVGRVKYLT